jgi:carbonic anhydrase
VNVLKGKAHHCLRARWLWRYRFPRWVQVLVIEQVYDLAKTIIVQNAWKSNQPVSIHGWGYGVASGFIKDLDVTIESNEILDEVY